MPDEEDDDRTVIQHRDEEMTNPDLPIEALSEPTLPQRPAVGKAAVPVPPTRARLASTPQPVPGPVRPRAPSVPPAAPAPRPRAPSRPEVPPMRPPRSSSEDIAAAISSAIASAQLPVVDSSPLVADVHGPAPLAAPIAPAPVAPLPVAPSPALVAPVVAEPTSSTPGWVVLYVLACFVLTALGAAVLVWWKMHGLW
jgi:hypothetical protein